MLKKLCITVSVLGKSVILSHEKLKLLFILKSLISKYAAMFKLKKYNELELLSLTYNCIYDSFCCYHEPQLILSLQLVLVVNF